MNFIILRKILRGNTFYEKKISGQCKVNAFYVSIPQACRIKFMHVKKCFYFSTFTKSQPVLLYILPNQKVTRPCKVNASFLLFIYKK